MRRWCLCSQVKKRKRPYTKQTRTKSTRGIPCVVDCNLLLYNQVRVESLTVKCEFGCHVAAKCSAVGLRAGRIDLLKGMDQLDWWIAGAIKLLIKHDKSTENLVECHSTTLLIYQYHWVSVWYCICTTGHNYQKVHHSLRTTWITCATISCCHQHLVLIIIPSQVERTQRVHVISHTIIHLFNFWSVCLACRLPSSSLPSANHATVDSCL